MNSLLINKRETKYNNISIVVGSKINFICILLPSFYLKNCFFFFMITFILLFSVPHDCIVDSYGNLYFTEVASNIIRMVAFSTNIISTIAGQTSPRTADPSSPNDLKYGPTGYSGNGGQAILAFLNFPTSITVNSLGDIYFADTNNSVVRKIAMPSRVITTVAGE